MTNQSMTLKEYFDRQEVEIQRKAAERRAHEATPEGKAELERSLAAMRADMEIDRAWAAANPPNRFDEGADACRNGEDRETPDGLDDAEQADWLRGWDSEIDSEGIFLVR